MPRGKLPAITDFQQQTCVGADTVIAVVDY